MLFLTRTQIEWGITSTIIIQIHYLLLSLSFLHKTISPSFCGIRTCICHIILVKNYGSLSFFSLYLPFNMCFSNRGSFILFVYKFKYKYTHFIPWISKSVFLFYLLLHMHTYSIDLLRLILVSQGA